MRQRSPSNEKHYHSRSNCMCDDIIHVTTPKNSCYFNYCDLSFAFDFGLAKSAKHAQEIVALWYHTTHSGWFHHAAISIPTFASTACGCQVYKAHNCSQRYECHPILLEFLFFLAGKVTHIPRPSLTNGMFTPVAPSTRQP